ncbi:MAG: DciA family protein [Edaphobacter sp.]|uniref:DciA family protein n=1 Tax=Edaphobacter sp. TaxID=1934404 RepID=UPI00239F980E|nr:DciA family protein [Edaphobacter sp.]MDE1176994.1 DciA family protein [Edaphobacter sp.]
MDGIRDLLKSNLGRSLRALQAQDRLEAAWLVACGPALAEHGVVAGYADGLVEIEVDGDAWLEQLRSMRSELSSALGRIAALPVTGIHFIKKR